MNIGAPSQLFYSSPITDQSTLRFVSAVRSVANFFAIETFARAF